MKIQYSFMKVLKIKARKALSKIIGKPFRYSKVLQKAEIISFDIFDTLIFRTVTMPTDVFGLISDSFFKSKRIKAEKAARQKARGEEITLDDIYQCFLEWNFFGNIEELKDVEIKAELSVCYANPEALKFYNELLEQRKRIIIISDMYLPASVMETILHNAGFIEYERLFVSSEYGLTKKSGNLFKKVQREMETRNIVHIGDNLLSDYWNARRMGLKGYLYKSCRKIEKETGELK